jgi:hypothetical protein
MLKILNALSALKKLGALKKLKALKALGPLESARGGRNFWWSALGIRNLNSPA